MTLKAKLKRRIGGTFLWEILRFCRRTLIYGRIYGVQGVRVAWSRGKKVLRPERRVRLKQYRVRLKQEKAYYRSRCNVHDLPEIFHYWSNKYLLPKLLHFGFRNPTEFFSQYMQNACRSFARDTCRFISVGAGNCDFEIAIAQKLQESGTSNFTIECLDLNRQMLGRGKTLAKEKGLLRYVHFVQADINTWQPSRLYHVVMANQSLHHITDLEILFDKVYDVLHPDGYFVADDMIGRNGHMRWPEALGIIHGLWKELPEKYKYNHQLERLESEFENWDCSKEGFEGIRAQDILPLLLETFHFEFFVAFGNVIDIFVDRSFGHNYDPSDTHDLEFIDKVHAIDEASIESGVIKPTHMMAAMTKHRRGKAKIYKHLSPEFCVRRGVTA